jgi:NAD(P)-dependent dehydrogenase (short-subunit alcohol dehydrogenase family)
MIMNIKDKVVLISGATGKLGRIVSQFIAERDGKLVLMGRKLESLNDLAVEISLPVNEHLLLPVDLSDPESVKSAAESAMEKFGKIDILLHFVGGWTGGVAVIEVNKDDITNMVQQHLWTTFHIVQEFVPKMVDAHWGRIIVISSPFALSPRAMGAPYAIGKAAQEALILTLAQELKGTGVTSNILLVKTIDTEHLRKSAPSLKNASWTFPEEISEAINYLVSDKAQMVNGARLPLYGSP